jgi:prepilin signal peptidase PulO-like enzyme (type II secretory pathway)
MYETAVRYRLLPDDAFAAFGIAGPLGITLPAIRHEQFFAHAVLFCFMLIAFWIDIDEMTIPDGVTIPGTLAALVIVTVWPFALLPESADVAGGPSGRLMLSAVWLTSPDQVPPSPDAPTALPRHVNPWEEPACTGWAALVAAIAGFCAWCLALAPGRWYTRHGFRRAVRVFTARMVRTPMTYVLLAMAVFGSLVIAKIWSIGGPHWVGLASSLAGIVIGGGLVWIIRIVASAVLHREAMGFGDVTLLAMIGAFLGWQAAVLVFFLSPFAGAVVGLIRLLLRNKDEIPYGPFLCLAAAATVLAWPILWDVGYRYFSLGWQLIAVLLVCLLLMVVLLLPVRWLVSRLRPR